MREGWQTRPLGEVCEIVNGGTPKTGVARYWSGAHLWITPAEMGKRATPYIDETERKLTDAGLADSSARLLPPLSIILSSRAPIGHLVINTQPMATNQGCKGLIPGHLVDHKFLFYYLGSIVGYLNELGTGATFKEISGGKLKEVCIPLPPLAEQKRIVAILDEAFEGIAAAKANAEKNLANARELFESYLNSIFTYRSNSWVETTVAQLVDQQIIAKPQDGNHGEIHPKKADFVSTGVPFIMASDLVNGFVDQETCNFLSYEQAKSLRIGFSKDGDILLSHKGTIGRVAVLQTSHDFVMLTPQVTFYRVLQNSKLSNKFLYYQFQTNEFQKQLYFYANEGSTRAYIGITKQLNLNMAYPLIEHQLKIVAILDNLIDQSRTLETNYRSKLNALAELKQSILQKAFAGELTSSTAQALADAAE